MRLSRVLLSASFVLLSGPAFANITINQVQYADWTPSASYQGTCAFVGLTPSENLTHLSGPTSAESTAMRSQFPGWTFTGGGQLNSTLTVNSYGASATSSMGGGSLSLTYAPAASDPSLASLHWIQMVSTNAPLGGATSPYVDPAPNDDTLPFFWTLVEDSTKKNGTAVTYTFSDGATRPYPTPPKNSVSWSGDLYLCSWDGNKGVTIYDEVSWGWYIEQYPTPCLRSGGQPVFDESTVQLSGLYPFLVVGGLRRRRRRASRRWLGAFPGAILAVLVIAFVLPSPLLADVRKLSKGGGSQIARLTLKLDKATQKEKEPKPIKLELKYTNRLLDDPITIWRSGFWPNHKVLVESEENDAEVPLTDMGKQYMKAFSPNGGRDKNVPRVIPAGESYIEPTPVDLGLLYKLKPGKYRVQVLYEDDQPPTPFHLRSNQVAFTIE